MNPSHHEALRESLGAHALGHLSSAEDSAVRSHLDECPQCQTEMTELASVVALLRKVDIESLDLEPPDLTRSAPTLLSRGHSGQAAAGTARHE